MSIDFTPDPALYPFESRWFDSSRGRIHYVDEGDGPPLLFCHGNPTWSFLYRDIIVACVTDSVASQLITSGSGYRSGPPDSATQSTNTPAWWVSSSTIWASTDT